MRGLKITASERFGGAWLLAVRAEYADGAETYARGAYPGVLTTLAQVVEGTPQVQTYEVSNSTFHKIAARATA